MRVLYARATCGEEEKEAVKQVLENPERLAGGEFTDRFEERVSDLFDKDHGVMVNSGSSANLLAVEALDLPEGSEVVTPVLTFSTTVAPLVQNSLRPVFVDAELGSYQADIEQVKGAITPDTEALMIPSLMGNIPKLPALSELAEDHDLVLIEDSCDTIGATIQGKSTGAFSHVSTTSFYGSHVITAFGGGGMVSVDDNQLHERLQVLRGWGRSSATDETEDIDDRLGGELADLEYDRKFIFEAAGYNFQTIEASAAYGLRQLDKLDDFAKARRQNFQRLRSFFSDHSELFVVPEEREDVRTNWLAFPLTLREDSGIERASLVKYLEDRGIQTRPLMSGNLLRHPGFKDIPHRRAVEEFPNADQVMRGSIVIGCHQSLDQEQLDFVEDTFNQFIDEHT